MTHANGQNNNTTRLTADQLAQVAADFTARLARQGAMQSGLSLMSGVRVYRLKPGWEKAVLMGDPRILRVEDCLALEQALMDPNEPTLLIPRGVPLTEEQVARACKGALAEKTIFIED